MRTPRVWEARTGAVHADMLAYSESAADDLPFLHYDLAGSVAHVLGLRRAGLLAAEEARALVAGLQSLHAEAQAGTFTLRPELEDGHMNVEAELTARLGDTGRRLHTGRSRNDQVATCITLHARDHLALLAASAHRLAAALAGRACEHAATPWVARTHGQPAQAATLGFLLAAHALRAADLAQAVLEQWERAGESPLGSGAVAGSTLPLDPAHTARLLGLRPPRSALLATGTRDTVLGACSAAASAGLVAAGLAQDLLDLVAQKSVRLPAGFTTGSSLMPQKRNPDSLELARAHGRRLPADLAAVAATLAGLPLGYHRDFQAVKPAQERGLRDARATLDILAAVVRGIEVDAAALSASIRDPAVAATDVAEALVACGMPFRTAYQAVAAAYAAAEAGVPHAEALAQQGLSGEALRRATEALSPDPARRATLGGPAPSQVARCLDDLAGTLAQVDGRVQAATATSRRPFALLRTPPEQLLLENA